MLEALAPTALLLVGSGVGWFIKSRIEARRVAEEALRAERAGTYTEILTPFARLFTDLSPASQQKALKEMLSFEYRQRSFKLVLIGDDGVVKAWNKMWDTLYRAERKEVEQKEVILAFGNVLRAIRIGIGAKKTTMSDKDMLRWLIKDIDSL